jgi:hypothetical protein
LLAAVPLFWFNQMDGRGPYDLEGSIREHQKLIRWYSEHEVPVELNEPHHWGMRDAPDVIFVVAAYLSAYTARAYGAQDYIAQMMFNSPPAPRMPWTWQKMAACLEICAPLENKHFHIWRQTRTGLLSYPLEDNAAPCTSGSQHLCSNGTEARYHPHCWAHRSPPCCQRR